MPTIAGLPTQVRATNPTDLEDYQDPALGAAGARKIATFDAHGQFRNALAPRGGVVFDGTSGAKVYSALANQTVGTDDFSLSCVFKVSPTTSRQMGVIYVASDTSPSTVTGLGFIVGFDQSGSLRVILFGSGTGNYRLATTTANVQSDYAEKVVHAVVTRSGSIVRLYLNGAAMPMNADVSSGTAPDWSSSIASGYFGIGHSDTTRTYDRPIYAATLYNLALSAADVQEIHELGGAVPLRFQFGSQVSGIASGNALSLGATDANTTPYSGGSATIDTIQSGARTGGAGSYYSRIEKSAGTSWAKLLTAPCGAGLGKVYRLRFWHRENTGTVGNVTFAVTGSSFATAASDISGTQDFTPTGTWTFKESIGRITVRLPEDLRVQLFSATVGAQLELDDVEFVLLGAVAHYACDDGLGYQLADASSNRLHATISPTGVAHLAGRPAGCIRFSTATAGDQQLLGQQVLPANARLRSWTIDSAGIPTVKLGRTSGGAELFAAAPLVAGLNDLALLSRFASTNNLYINSTTSDLLQHTIEYDVVD